MANYEILKASINAVVKPNGNEEIDGQTMQNVLNTIVSTIGKDRQFVGIALPGTTPGTPDGNVFYMAFIPGIYSNFGGVEVSGLTIIYNTTSGWLSTFIQDLGTNRKIKTDKQSIFSVPSNKINIEELQTGVYFNWDNSLISLNASYSMTPYIEVETGVEYQFRNVGQLIWFDKNFKQLGFQTNSNAKTFDVGVKYVVLNIQNSLINSALMAKHNITTHETRFFEVLKKTSRLNKFPLDDETPLRKDFIDFGVDKFYINGYIDLEFDPNITHSFGTIQKGIKTLRLYRKTKNLIPSGNVTELATFTSQPIPGSNYELMTTTHSNLKNCWFIVDWNAINTDSIIYNCWDVYGLAFSKKIYKGGIWSRFATTENIQSLILDINANKNSIIGINETLFSVFKQENIFDNEQKFPSNAYSNQNANSTFSGWGWIIGVVKNFDAVEVCVINRHETEPITKLRVVVRYDDFEGQLLADKTINVHVPPGEEQYIAVKFDSLIENSTEKNIYLEYYCDKIVTRKAYMGAYSFKPGAGFPNGRYSTNGNITGAMAAGTSVYPNYWKAGILVNSMVLSDPMVNNIAERLNLTPPEPIQISLPDKINAVVGDTLQLFFRGIIQSVDPYKYDILVTCSKGKKFPRYFEYTPTTADIGDVTFRISVKDDNGQILGSGQTTISTKAAVKSPTTPINIVSLGDSLTSAGIWCAEANRRLTGTGGTPAGNGFSNISFIGAKHNGTTGYFGVGGWTWDSYTTQGRPAYRFQVSGVNSLSIGATYTNNGNTFTIMEVNVTGATGNILCSVSSLTPAPTASGVLTKASGGGDSTISFSSVATDTQNPLWDYANNKMTFIPYAYAHGGGKIDVVYTLLSWNGQTPWREDFSTVINNIKIMADTLHAEFPNAKLKILGIQIPSINGGMGYNYGATGTSYADGYGMVVTALNQNKAYQEFANRPEYSSFVEFVNVSAQFDSEYNMPASNKSANTRSAITEVVGENGVHPNNDGYLSIGDVVYRNIINNYCQ